MNLEEIVDFLEYSISQCKVSPGHYSVVYHSKEFEGELSGDKAKDYARISAVIYLELEELISSGKVTRQNFESDKSEVERTLIAFTKNGFLDIMVIQREILEIAKIRGIDTGTVTWLLMYRPTICSAIYTTAEGMTKRDKEGQESAMLRLGEKLSDRDWTLYFSDYLMRTLLRVEFANQKRER